MESLIMDRRPTRLVLVKWFPATNHRPERYRATNVVSGLYAEVSKHKPTDTRIVVTTTGVGTMAVEETRNHGPVIVALPEKIFDRKRQAGLDFQTSNIRATRLGSLKNGTLYTTNV